ncbi:MAG TPA: ABC transporter permease, partial [Methylophaga sp.]|nr:ABC transporter permease [Methylophaga sp.]
MIEVLRSLGRWGLDTFQRLGRGHIFLMQMLAGMPSLAFRFSLVVQQLFYVG